MELVKRGFRAGTGRMTSMLTAALSGDKETRRFIITDELISNNVVTELPWSDYLNCKTLCGVRDAESVIGKIICSLEGIPTEEPVEIYVHSNNKIDFDKFRDVDNVTIYHYVQLQREGICNSERVSK